jgi:hypothetical protein
MTIRALPYFRRRHSGHLAYQEDTVNWEKTWNILANMASLRELRVVLLDKSVDGIWETRWLFLEGTLLEPAKSVNRPRKFEIVMPYTSCRLDWDMGESRCVLKKPESREGAIED